MILLNRQSLHFLSKSVTILVLVTRTQWFYIRSTRENHIFIQTILIDKSLIRYLESINLSNLKKATMLYLLFAFSSSRTETVDAFLVCFALWWLRDGLIFRLSSGRVTDFRLSEFSRYLKVSMHGIYCCCYNINILLKMTLSFTVVGRKQLTTFISMAWLPSLSPSVITPFLWAVLCMWCKN